MYCGYKLGIVATTSKYLNKNKCSYLEYHFFHSNKFSMSNKNNGMLGKIK